LVFIQDHEPYFSTSFQRLNELTKFSLRKKNRQSPLPSSDGYCKVWLNTQKFSKSATGSIVKEKIKASEIGHVDETGIMS